MKATALHNDKNKCKIICFVQNPAKYHLVFRSAAGKNKGVDQKPGSRDHSCFVAAVHKAAAGNCKDRDMVQFADFMADGSNVIADYANYTGTADKNIAGIAGTDCADQAFFQLVLRTKDGICAGDVRGKDRDRSVFAGRVTTQHISVFFPDDLPAGFGAVQHDSAVRGKTGHSTYACHAAAIAVTVCGHRNTHLPVQT